MAQAVICKFLCKQVDQRAGKLCGGSSYFVIILSFLSRPALPWSCGQWSLLPMVPQCLTSKFAVSHGPFLQRSYLLALCKAFIGRWQVSAWPKLPCSCPYSQLISQAEFSALTPRVSIQTNACPSGFCDLAFIGSAIWQSCRL